MSIPFWQKDPDAPYATLLRVIAGACHPEAWEDAYEDLQRVARDRPDTEQMIRFKDELRRAIHDPSQVAHKDLFEAAVYSDGSAEKFLARLWRDLYPDEPLPDGRTG